MDRSLRDFERSYRLAKKGRFSAALRALPPPPLGKGNSNWAEYRLTLKLVTHAPVDSHDLLALFTPRLTKIGKEHVTEVATVIDDLLDEWRSTNSKSVLEELAGQTPEYDWRDWNLAHLSGTFDTSSKAVVRTFCFGASVAMREIAHGVIRDAENSVRESMGMPRVRERKGGPRKAEKSRVAMPGYVHTEAALPNPFVHYTGPYGTFLAFSKARNSVPTMCSCSRSAVENLLEIMQSFPPAWHGRESPSAAVFRGHYFPEAVIQIAKSNAGAPLSALSFEDKLCHRCTLATPSLRYCNEMYGGVFMQHHGWYVNQAFLRLGVLPRGNGQMLFPYLDSVCPADVAELIRRVRRDQILYMKELERLNVQVQGSDREDISPDEITYWHNVKPEEAEPMQELRRKAAQSNRSVTKRFENIAREEFGFRNVGEQWVSETLLFNLVSRIYQGRQVIHHHRPEWLKGLELDIFVPDLKIGFEYQGQQHFHPVMMWGGKESLKATQARDQHKRELCRHAEVQLVAIDYTEPLTEEHVRNRIMDTA